MSEPTPQRYRQTDVRTTLTDIQTLKVRGTRLSTVGDRSFPVAAPRTWNSLPRYMSHPHTICLVFLGGLKDFLLRLSLP